MCASQSVNMPTEVPFSASKIRGCVFVYVCVCVCVLCACAISSLPLLVGECALLGTFCSTELLRLSSVSVCILKAG